MQIKWIKNLAAMMRELRRPERLEEKPVILDGYVGKMPAPQNAVDLIGGWNSVLPPFANVDTGAIIPMYQDPRIDWCIGQFGDLGGRRVLELGPLEGVHTYLLHCHQPSVIHAIEANKLSFMRCLVVRQLLALDRAQFLLGDFLKWLAEPPMRYDLIVASGVLYHMRDPMAFLRLIADCADSVYLWTHYFGDDAMPIGDPRRGAFMGEVKIANFSGQEIRLHRRSYHHAWKSAAFCGGMEDEHYWMEKTQIVDVLKGFGFDDVRLEHDTPDHPNGPSISIFARRTIGR